MFVVYNRGCIVASCIRYAINGFALFGIIGLSTWKYIMYMKQMSGQPTQTTFLNDNRCLCLFMKNFCLYS